MSEIELTDLEEAKIMISMKNDEIRSLTNKMKMLQKKSNIKIAESSYQIQQEKNKYQDLEKKLQKLKDTHALELNKFFQSEENLKQEIGKLKESISEMQKHERQLQRSHKAQMYEFDLSLNEVKQKNNALKKELLDILKLFNPNEIMKELNIKSIHQIPPYLKIRSELQQKTQEAIILTHSLQQYKSSTLQAMQESFSKLNSYEEVMVSLREKNNELEEIMAEKQKHLQEKHNELEEKDNFIAKVEALTAQKYYEMNDQIENLRKSVQYYERESQSYLESRDEQEKNLKFIFELSAEFEQKEQDYLSKINELESAFSTSQSQKKQLIQQFRTTLEGYRDELLKYQNIQKRLQGNIQDKNQIIKMLTNSLKELQAQLQTIKKQLDKSKIQINELIRRKHKLQEELKESEALRQAKEQSLMEEIQLLKNYRHTSGDSFEDHQEKNSRAEHSLAYEEDATHRTGSSLKDEMQPEPNWLQIYENTLQKQNAFVKQIHYLLRKQVRKQSFSMEA